ncbi:hypothetical protein SAMN06295912_10967 [Sphingomonas laterariae]|uniref:Uncharacterized protein n=1 Tax=Edaphosphingomonas laterariae TaxID=861865 RepID=A0A239FKU1_9SPHN|nr:hypothetical protein [Sphingomonas laterariae]SNS56832.1 hypothetical protein SAMN06295912_10967 [Sphingomonas laterariae]
MAREMIAYGLIGVMVVGGAIWSTIAWRRHQRVKLRRRGISPTGIDADAMIHPIG